MCGIAGLYSFDKMSQTEVRDLSRGMLTSLEHRGPDDQGYWISDCQSLLFCQVRLSILDLSENGHQPMHSHNGNFVIIYNGEIYNHLEIRRSLERDGLKTEWLGVTDTETLLEAISFWGIEKTLKVVVGMFAFAVMDKANNILTLARDRFGEKPLYWGWQNRNLYFASELSGISCNLNFVAKVDRDSLNQLVRYNYIPAPSSIYNDISKLLPGHFISFDFNVESFNAVPVSYWSLLDNVKKNNQNSGLLSTRDAVELLDDNLIKVVQGQMLSDVPIGAFLSGGIDSSIIVALMQRIGGSKVNTFTIGFNNPQYDEAVYARRIAEHIGTEHSELYIDDSDLINLTTRMGQVYSEPFADSSQIPTFLLSQLVSRHVKVALTGDAGDELFGGYNQYRFMPRIWKYLDMVPLKLRLSTSKYIDLFNRSNKIEKFNNILPSINEMDAHKRLVSHWPDADLVVLNSSEPNSYFLRGNFIDEGISFQEKMMLIDSLTYLTDDILVKVDRAAMANGLETRVPFLDHNFFELVWSLPIDYKISGQSGKLILKELLSKYVPNNLVDRPKRGFSLPLGEWLRGPLKEWAEELLSFDLLSKQGYFNAKIIEATWLEHLNERRDNSLKLWSILMFQSWLEFNMSRISE